MQKLLIYLAFISLGVFPACGKKPASANTGDQSAGLKLEYMEVQEPRTNTDPAELFLHGQFGTWNSSSAVHIGTNIFSGQPDPSNRNATILAWSPNLIWLRIPKADEPGGSGAVKVASGGKESNRRTLNVWTGTLTYNYPSGGNLHERVDIDFILRADCKPYANVPVNNLMKPKSSFARGSTAQWVIEGTATSLYEGCTMNVKWDAQSGAIGWSAYTADNTNLSESFQSEISYVGVLKVFRVNALKIHKFNASRSTILISGCSQGEPQIQDVHLTEMPTELAKMVEMNVDATTSAITPGRVSLGGQPNHAGLIYEGTPPNLVAEISWSTIQAKYPNE